MPSHKHDEVCVFTGRCVDTWTTSAVSESEEYGSWKRPYDDITLYHPTMISQCTQLSTLRQFKKRAFSIH